jgi:peptidoglycan L-alanyl-D-glutamate endopeptidase CwlK
MPFVLSQKSVMKMQGVDPKLVSVINRAIQLSEVDFSITCGMRTQAEQEELFKKKATQTLKSKHLDGKAVDVMAFKDGKGSWDLPLYVKIADAVKAAAKELGVQVRWGAAWSVPDISKWEGSMQEAMDAYVAECKKKGTRPFIDGPHFEVP